MISIIGEYLATAVLLFVVFSCKWILDSLQFHYERSFWARINKQSYFNPSISWVRKHDIRGGKFKRWLFFNPLVFLTDFWHLVQFVYLNSLCTVVALSVFDGVVNTIIGFISIRAIYSLCGLIWYKN